MSKIEQMRVNFMQRNARKNGPATSALINDSIDELAVDWANLEVQWNDSLYPLLDTVPSGSASDGTDKVDAFTNGLDGSTLYVDSDTSSTGTGATYYNSSRSRPNTISEQFVALYDYLDETWDDIRSELVTAANPWSEAVKERIGMNIFDSSETSSATSLDGKIDTNTNNITQLAKDMYGSGAALGGDGVADLATDVSTNLDNIETFVGMADATDATPTYSSNNYVTDGDSLETAIGKLDTTVADALDGISTMNGLTVAYGSETVGDDDEVIVATGVTGWGFAQAGDNQEYAQFTWTAAGAVTLIVNTANVNNADVDGDFCIYDNGAGIAIKNRLGADLTVRYSLFYS